ncbi:MAG: Gfo/Idh/MocA family oxidoreductase [Clostridia bacterium]|nr:Gfo/Idh/MocA family oxidoreductase [Clostridia bacterium]
MEQKKKLKVAQIGAAHLHAGAALSTIRRHSDLFELLGYGVPEEEKNTPFYEMSKKYETHTPEEILDLPDLDAVFIEVSEKNLTKYALAAARRGLNVYMDKPGGIGLREFEELVQTIKEKGKILHLGYMYRYNPAVKKLLEKVKKGELGEIYSVEGHMSCFTSLSFRDFLKEYPGGMMFQLGCHLLDLVLQIQGLPEEVIPLNAKTGFEGKDSVDFGFAALRYKNGTSFIKTSAVERGGFCRRQLVVCGTKGTVELRPLERDATEKHNDSKLCTDIYETYSDEWVTVPEKSTTDIYNRYDDMMLSFASVLRGEKENLYSADYELSLYKTLLKCCGE